MIKKMYSWKVILTQQDGFINNKKMKCLTHPDEAGTTVLGPNTDMPTVWSKFQKGDVIVGHLKDREWTHFFGIVPASACSFSAVTRQKFIEVWTTQRTGFEHKLPAEAAELATRYRSTMDQLWWGYRIGDDLVEVETIFARELGRFVPKDRRPYFVRSVVETITRNRERRFGLLGTTSGGLICSYAVKQVDISSRFALRVDEDDIFGLIRENAYMFPALMPLVADGLTCFFQRLREPDIGFQRFCYIVARCVVATCEQSGCSWIPIDSVQDLIRAYPEEARRYPNIRALLSSRDMNQTPLTVDVERGIIKLTITVYREKTIAQDLVALTKEDDWDDIQPSLDQPMFRIDVRHKEKQLNMKQREAVKMISTKRVCVLTGEGGTGKTGVLAYCNHAIRDATDDVELIYLTFSGKAANRLREEGIHQAMTMHSFIFRAKDIYGTNRPGKRGTGHQVTPRAILIIDEVSMIPIDVLAETLNVMYGLYMYRFSIVLAGDKAQLPPIGSCNMMLVAEKLEINTLILTENHRLEAAGATIGYNARFIRDGGVGQVGGAEGLIDPKTGLRLEPGVFEIEEPGKNILPVVSTLYEFNLDTFRESVVITPTRKLRNSINSELQKIYLNDMHQRHKHKPKLLPKQDKLHFHDRVMHTRNCYAPDLSYEYDKHGRFLRFRGLMVMNGEYGIIQDESEANPNGNGVRVQLERRSAQKGSIGGTSVIYETGPAQFMLPHATAKKLHVGDLEPFYAGTCHVLQGSEQKEGIICIDWAGSFDRRWLYTAVTRFTTRVIIVANRKDIKSMMDKPVPAEYEDITYYAMLLSE